MAPQTTTAPTTTAPTTTAPIARTSTLRARSRRVRLAGLAFAVLLATGLPTLGQGFSGTFVTQGDGGEFTISLTQDAQGAVRGTLVGAEASFTIEGVVDDVEADVAYGTAEAADGVLAFEAFVDEDGLYLVLYDLTPDGQLDVDNAVEAFFERQGATATPDAAASAPDAAALDAPSGNPLGAHAANPLAAADPFLGSFGDGALTLHLDGAADGYQGQITLGGESYPLTARAGGAGLTGTFQSGGSSFGFEATLQGDTLTLVTGGARYSLQRQAANPLAGPTPAATAATPAVIVRGAYADLTEDDALAFIEALEFSLQQVGYVYTFTEGDRQQLLAAIVQAYPQADQEEQLVMAQARRIWTETQQAWPGASEADRRAFVLAVFTLAFGEEVVQQAGGGAAGAAGGCASFDDCAGAYMDGETWTDAQNAQSCWASAGCGGYDAGTDSFYDPVGEPMY